MVQKCVASHLITASTETVQQPIAYTYDALRRQTAVQDPRTSTSTTTVYYTNTTDSGGYLGQVKSVTDGAGNATTYTYYKNESWHGCPAGSLMTSTNAAGNKTHHAYSARGEQTHTWGDEPYPLRYEYNSYGERTAMDTYQGGTGWTAAPASGAAIPTAFNSGNNRTTWTYDAGSGFLTAKTDAASAACTFTYYAGTALEEKRLWARLVTPSGGGAQVNLWRLTQYDVHGQPTSTTYADTTPSVTYTYQRDGDLDTVVDAAGTHTFTESASGSSMIEQEAITGTGYLSGHTTQITEDAYGRRTLLNATKTGVSGALTNVSYGYESATNRLQTVTDTASSLSGNYTYESNSDLAASVAMKNGSTTVMTHQKSYDSQVNRINSANNTVSGSSVSCMTYTYDNLQRRTKLTCEDGTYWDIAYNTRNEVTGGIRKSSGGTALPGWNFGYGFDNIGNRTGSSGATEDGIATGYTLNGVNQYTPVTNPSQFIIKGKAPGGTATVTVDGNNVTPSNVGDFFKATASTSNGSAPKYHHVQVSSSGDTMDYYQYICENSEARTYDADGNLKQDSRWIYTWDGENRLVRLQTTTAAVNAGAPNLDITYAYDYMGRRIAAGNYRFVNDGWNIVARCSTTGSYLQDSYVWGLDVSGGTTGAGGVGGLLICRCHTAASNHFVGYDGNGNVGALVYASGGSQGQVSAHYAYEPFGQQARSSGAFCYANPFRFSTKYVDDETGFSYYGHRYLDASNGRWLNRDPIGERGGDNLYEFADNDGIHRIDSIGLDVSVLYHKVNPIALMAARGAYGLTLARSQPLQFEVDDLPPRPHTRKPYCARIRVTRDFALIMDVWTPDRTPPGMRDAMPVIMHEARRVMANKLAYWEYLENVKPTLDEVMLCCRNKDIAKRNLTQWAEGLTQARWRDYLAWTGLAAAAIEDETLPQNQIRDATGLIVDLKPAARPDWVRSRSPFLSPCD